MSKAVSAVQAIATFVGLGISFYLQYLILTHINATEFMWFYWGVVIFISILLAGTHTALRQYQLGKDIDKYLKGKLKQTGF